MNQETISGEAVHMTDYGIRLGTFNSRLKKQELYGYAMIFDLKMWI